MTATSYVNLTPQPGVITVFTDRSGRSAIDRRGMFEKRYELAGSASYSRQETAMTSATRLPSAKKRTRHVRILPAITQIRPIH
ncbi:MAG: hypothetical protein ACREV0_09990 [Burkholderiales bacterium]